MTDSPPTVSDSGRRLQLLALKLGALVRDHTGASGTSTPATWPGGAALVTGDAAWVLAEDDPERALGAALAWARQQGVSPLNVVAERATGVLARRAAFFLDPPAVWHADGRVLIEAIAEPYLTATPVDADLLALRTLMVEGGAEPSIEHGVLAGEVEGLEVCRAVRDTTTGAARLEVGVGTHDREAFQMIHGDLPPVEALRRVVEAVRPHRQPGAAPHPLNRIGAERALRARLLRDPALVGARELRAAPPPAPRTNLKDNVPCVATGTAEEGEMIVVVCSHGVDLDVVPFAADARGAFGDERARLVIALPPRDAVSVTRALASLLRCRAEIVEIPPV